jgi:hypothetical protein
MSTPTAQRRQARRALAISIAGLVTAVLWLLVTILETDSGWEDAIWRYSSSSKTAAWVTTLLGAAAALSALVLARRLQVTPSRSTRRRFAVSVASQLILFGTWAAAIYTAPS